MTNPTWAARTRSIGTNSDFFSFFLFFFEDGGDARASDRFNTFYTGLYFLLFCENLQFYRFWSYPSFSQSKDIVNKRAIIFFFFFLLRLFLLIRESSEWVNMIGVYAGREGSDSPLCRPVPLLLPKGMPDQPTTPCSLVTLSRYSVICAAAIACHTSCRLFKRNLFRWVLQPRRWNSSQSGNLCPRLTLRLFFYHLPTWKISIEQINFDFTPH